MRRKVDSDPSRRALKAYEGQDGAESSTTAAATEQAGRQCGRWDVGCTC